MNEKEIANQNGYIVLPDGTKSNQKVRKHDISKDFEIVN